MRRTATDHQPGRPRTASLDEVRISREGGTAVIEYADSRRIGVRLRFGSRLAAMTDAEVLEEHNAILGSQAEFSMEHRARRPRKASPDEVRISREDDTAVIEYADPSILRVHLRFGARLAAMTDAEVLEEHNAILEAKDEYAAEMDRPLIEIPSGLPQIEFCGLTQQWETRGDVLRCHIGSDQGETFVWIDDLKLGLDEFGDLLQVFEGFGMRIAFVDQDEVACEPEIEVKEPADPENG